jgi:hypothetical protein
MTVAKKYVTSPTNLPVQPCQWLHASLRSTMLSGSQ